MSRRSVDRSAPILERGAPAGAGRSVETTGRTAEEAILKALTELNATRDQVDVRVVKEGGRSMFGLRSELAVVIVALRVAPAEVEKKVPPAEAMPVAEVGRIAQETVEQLLRGMHVNGRVSLRQPSQAEGEPITLDITGDDLGILIGRRGETLGAIQFITRLIVSHRTHQRTNIIVDVEGYKQRREHILQDLARRMAERVEQSGRPVELEAMPAYERRIVHLTLRDHPHVTTQSIGEGAGRKVTIIPKS